jgi:hypothetical protein
MASSQPFRGVIEIESAFEKRNVSVALTSASAAVSQRAQVSW